jgi:hypothetical protein
MLVENSSIKNKMVAALNKWAFMCLSIFLLGTAGCCGESALERDYGNAWAYNQAAEIANPQAGLVETPAVGLSPKVSTNVIDAYNKSFTGPKSGGGSQTTINLGGLTTSGSGGSSGGGN